MLAILLAMTLTVLQSLSPWVMTGIVGTGILTFLGLAMATKIITGEERLIYYHHEIAILATAALFLKIANQPVLHYMDITILGIGTFLVCGRVGCFMGGCCHGRPNKWGVTYRSEHAAAGFTPHYVGVRLFPIQMIESIWVLGVVLVGTIFILNDRPHGQALAWYVISYGIGRFSIEFVRGDPARPYYWGFSEGQWTTVLLMCAVVWTELNGTLSLHPWHIATTAGIVSAMMVIALIRLIKGKHTYRLFLPHHVKEIVEAVERIAHSSAGKGTSAESDATPDNIDNIPVSCTSQGIRISTQKVENGAGRLFTISLKEHTMTGRLANKLADLILKLKFPAASGELIIGNQGVFHLLIHPSDRKSGHATIKPQATLAPTGHASGLRQEITNGLLYCHGRLNTNTQLAFEVQCQLNALRQIMEKNGIIAAGELDEQKEIAAQKLSKEFQDRGIGSIMLDPAPDKYSLEEVAKVDCENRIHLCRAACCRLSFSLSGQDVDEGIVRWNMGQPYLISHKEDGYCSHLDRESLTCSIYAHQPAVCQTYHCRKDKRIWIDFNNRVINPEIVRSDWPSCIKAETGENENHQEKAI